jgi:hypothetical protein
VGELGRYDLQKQARQAQDEQSRPEQADGQAQATESGAGAQRAPAEHRSREEYAREMRLGAFVPASEPSARDEHDLRNAEPPEYADRATAGEHRPGDRISGPDEGLRRRVADLESENAQLATSMQALEEHLKRLDRLEHASHEQPTVGGKERSDPDVAAEEATPGPRGNFPRWASTEAVGFAAAVGGGTLTTMADFLRAFPAAYAGIAASALGVGASGLGWYRKRREERDAPRRGH